MVSPMRIPFARLRLLAALSACCALRAQDAAPSPAPVEPPAESIAPAAASPDPAWTQVDVAPASTSIYIGKVTLTMTPFQRAGADYSATYVAKVFPYFFQNEKGSLTITLTDADLAQLAAGQRVYFSGDAANTDGEPRKIEGHADPADASSGRIKVRVFVTEKIQLIFNTTYRFTGGR